MKFPSPLVRGRLIKRYKRFLADVTLEDGAVVTAHCANPGSMLGLTEAGAEVWLSRSGNPARKLPYSWELLRVGSGLVGINTAHPNRIAEEAIRAGRVAELRGYETIRREVRYGERSRVDLLLEGPGRPPCYVEVKNVHLRREAHAEFPDSVTARGTRHLRELAGMVENGARSVMFYVVQRTDCDRFRIAGDIDPAYEAALSEALVGGVEAICYACRITMSEISLERALSLDLKAGAEGYAPERRLREGRAAGSDV